MKQDSRRIIQSGVLALSLCFAQAGTAGAEQPRNDGPEFNATFTIPGMLGSPETTIHIPIDCDLLGPNGQKTLEFVKQFGIWGHITEETDINRAEQHLRLHGITPERIENVRRYCVENYL